MNILFILASRKDPICPTNGSLEDLWVKKNGPDYKVSVLNKESLLVNATETLFQDKFGSN